MYDMKIGRIGNQVGKTMLLVVLVLYYKSVDLVCYHTLFLQTCAFLNE